VNINGACAAKTTDGSGCAGKFIVTGSGTVHINSQPAARASDLTTDGAILLGSTNVRVGGPRTGATIGSAAAQKRACQEAANTRASGKTKQSWGNCGLESWRNLVNKQRAERGQPPVTEAEMLRRTIDLDITGEYSSDKPDSYGATNGPGRVKVLNDYGIKANYEGHDAARLREHVMRERPSACPCTLATIGRMRLRK